jgi:hypothetical protein
MDLMSVLQLRLELCHPPIIQAAPATITQTATTFSAVLINVLTLGLVLVQPMAAPGATQTATTIQTM